MGLHSPPSDCVKGEARGQEAWEQEESLQQSCGRQKAGRDAEVLSPGLQGQRHRGAPHVLPRLRPGFLSPGLADVGGRAVLWCGDCSLHYRMFQSIPASTYWTTGNPCADMSTETCRPCQMSPLGTKLPAGESHWPGCTLGAGGHGCRSRQRGRGAVRSWGQHRGVRWG